MEKALINNISLKQFLISKFPGLIYFLSRKPFVKDQLEIKRLLKMGRRQHTSTFLIGKPFRLTDAASFLQIYEEVFIQNIYKFHASNSSPVIIDCGSNVGVSVLYFKKEYPNAKVIGFEPDPDAFKVLKHNVEQYNYKNVVLHNKAIWTSKTTVKFKVEGGASGKISESEEDNLIEVETQSLKDLINERIDLLKIDIEGAEYEVIKDCKDKLDLVENLFVEYHSSVNEKQKLNEILEILTQKGFRYHIKEAYAAPCPFVDRPTMLGMDLQLNIFAFRD